LPHPTTKSAWSASGRETQFQAIDHHLAWFQVDGLARAREIIGPLPADLQRREGRRRLLDMAGEPGQGGTDRLIARPILAGGGDGAFAVVGRARLAEAQGEAVLLASVHHEGNGLGRLAQGDRQDAGRQRIERAAMARLFRREQPAHAADRLGRAHAQRLVEHDPSVDLLLRSLCLHLSSMSRATSGRRRSEPILSASSKVRSSSKRISARCAARLLAHPRTEPGGRTAHRGQQPLLVLAAQRHDESDGVAQIGADVDRRHRDPGVAQLRIAHVAALQQVGQQMADLLADAQLALAVAAIVFVDGATPGHGAFLKGLWAGRARRATAMARPALQGRLNFLDVEAFDHVADLDVVVVLETPCRTRSRSAPRGPRP
jgi:hypothetical protein